MILQPWRAMSFGQAGHRPRRFPSWLSMTALPAIQVVKLLKAINDVPHGGQILIDASTFAAINSIIHDIAKLLGPRPDFDSLVRHTQAARWVLPACIPRGPGLLSRKHAPCPTPRKRDYLFVETCEGGAETACGTGGH